MTDYDKIVELIKIKCYNCSFKDATDLIVNIRDYCENLLDGSNLAIMLDEEWKKEINHNNKKG